VITDRRAILTAPALSATCLALLLTLAPTAEAGKKKWLPRPAPTATATATAAPSPTATMPASPAPAATPIASNPTATPAPGGVPSPAPAGRWAPTPRTGWQIQLQGRLDTSVDVPVYVIDGYDTPASTVAALRASGRHAICYISAGSWEDWRPDAADFPTSVLGRSNGWPGERWLDIRQLEALKPILSKRMRMCRDKGFEAVDPDNVDGYTNVTGFPLTAAHQLAFNRWLATEAHSLGLSIGLKNDLDQVAELVDFFDFAVNEQCFEYDECALLEPFVKAGKAVLHIEYTTSPARYCTVTTGMGLSSLLKRLDLMVWRQAC
jgi:hypothetical protein